MSRLPLSFACWNYDRTEALQTGRVQPDGIDLNFQALDVEETFFRMLRNREFDVAELSMSSYCVTLGREDPGFIAIPVFPSRFFRHSCIFVSKASGIEKPADLAGVKIRTPPNPVILSTMKQLGALAESIPFGQVYTALQSHVVAAVEPEMRDYYDSKWYEVAKHLSISNYIWTANWWFMNKDRFDALTPDEQAAVQKAAGDTVNWYRGELSKAYEDTQKALETKGVTVTKVDTAPFVDLVKPVYDQFSKEWGADLVSTVQKAASAN